MNTIKRISMATFLVVPLTTTTCAGTIHTGATTPPPPPPEQSTATATPETVYEPGEIGTGSEPSDLGTDSSRQRTVVSRGAGTGAAHYQKCVQRSPATLGVGEKPKAARD
jgi:hypothetical protein